MPCRNGDCFLRSAIESVESQSYSDWELLIVDDGSTDDSQAIIRDSIDRDARIRSFQTRRLGAAAARNVALAAATGKYIAFLDCDDRWAPAKLARQAELFAAGVAFTWSAYNVVGANGKVTQVQKAPERISYKELLHKRAVIGCLTASYNCHLLGKQEMPPIGMRQDYALFLRLLRICAERSLCAQGCAEPLAHYRVHAGNMTRSKARAAQFQWRVYREIEHLSALESLRAMVAYLISRRPRSYPVATVIVCTPTAMGGFGLLRSIAAVEQHTLERHESCPAIALRESLTADHVSQVVGQFSFRRLSSHNPISTSRRPVRRSTIGRFSISSVSVRAIKFRYVEASVWTKSPSRLSTHVPALSRRYRHGQTKKARDL